MRDVAVTVRGRRRDLGLTQEALAQRAGVSRRWLVAFEAGKATAEFSAILRVIDALGLRLDVATDDAAGPPATEQIDLDALLARYRGD